MKKVLAICTSIIMLIIMCSCGKINNDKLTGTHKTYSHKTIPANTSNDYADSDIVVDKFLKALVNKDESALKELSFMDNPECYTSLYQNIKITDYIYSIANNMYSNYLWDFKESPKAYYNVTLSTTDITMQPSSSNDSNWVLAVNGDKIVLFTNADTFTDQNDFNSDNLALCYIFGYQLFVDMYPADFKESSQDNIDNICSLAGTIYNLSLNYNDEPINADTLNKFIADTFKTSDFDARKSSFFNKSTDSIENYLINFFPPMKQVNSFEKTSAGDYCVTVTYYIDNLMMIKEKTVIYTLSFQPNHKYTMISTNTFYDGKLS